MLAFTTFLAEDTRWSLKLKLLEANALVAFEDGRAIGSPGGRSLLDPAFYGFNRTLPALNEVIAFEMDDYAKVLGATESALNLIKGIVADVVKRLANDPSFKDDFR